MWARSPTAARTGTCLLGHRLQGRAANAPQRTAQLGEVPSAHFSHFDGAPLTTKERHAELVFERLNLSADRALTLRQFTGRAYIALETRCSGSYGPRLPIQFSKKWLGYAKLFPGRNTLGA